MWTRVRSVIGALFSIQHLFALNLDGTQIAMIWTLMKLTKLEINRNLLIVSKSKRCNSNGNFAQNVWCTRTQVCTNESRNICSGIGNFLFDFKPKVRNKPSIFVAWHKMQLESIFGSICFTKFGAKRSSRLMLTSLFAMQSVVVVWCQRGIMINIKHFSSNATLLLSNNYALDLSADIIDCCRSDLHWSRLIYFWTLSNVLYLSKSVCFNFN